MEGDSAPPAEVNKSIWVNGLNADTTEETVIEAFKSIADVVSAFKKQDRPWAYVDFADVAGHDAAIAAGSLTVDGVTCTIHEKDATRSRPRGGGGAANGGGRRRKSAADPDAVNTSIYVKNLTPAVTQPEIAEAFAQFGKVDRVDLRRRESGCYAFVSFGTPEEMQAAIDASGPVEIGESVVEIEEKRAPPKPRAHVPTSENSIYVRDFPEDTTEDQLREAFGSHGDIVSVIKRVKTYDGEDGGPSVTRTWAFVEYSTSGVASAAVEAAQGSPVSVNGAAVSVELRNSKPVLQTRGRGRRAPKA